MPQITLNGARHYYRLEGDIALPPLVLIHPIGADLGLWDKVVPLLTQRHCVLRYDLRGHGGSEATSGEYSLQMLSQDLLALTSALGLERFALCGVSLGGMTALHTAFAEPSRVTSLVIASTATQLSPPPGGWDGRAQHALSQGMQSLAGPMIERMFSAAFRGTKDASVETMRTVFAQMSPQGYASACAVLRDTDLAGELSRVVVPVLVVSGADDLLVSPQVGTDIAAAIPGARQLVMPCGHFPPLEAAEAFATALADFASSAR